MPCLPPLTPSARARRRPAGWDIGWLGAVLIGFLLSAVPGPLSAQGGGTAPAARPAVELDDLVRIQLADEAGTWTSGRVTFVRGDSIFVDTGNSRPRGFGWSDIALMERRVAQRSRAGLGLVLGGLIGAGVGFGSEFCVLCTDSAEGKATVIGAVIGAGLGFAIGSAVRSDRWSVVAAPTMSGVNFGIELGVGRIPQD